MSKYIRALIFQNFCDQAGLDHALRAAEIEFDRIAEAEVRALVLRQRRERIQLELSKRKLVKAPLHPPSLNEVGGREQQSALSVPAVPKKDRKAVMKHLTDVAHKERQELKARLALETQRFITKTTIIFFNNIILVTTLLLLFQGCRQHADAGEGNRGARARAPVP
jgi:hypothetical protein